ncbi:hypothetical protein G6F66_015437 [Rhizopus arrhizus]|nr:hypothetical protein G6F66_015437 [Rhizopus arrhizus]
MPACASNSRTRSMSSMFGVSVTDWNASNSRNRSGLLSGVGLFMTWACKTVEGGGARRPFICFREARAAALHEHLGQARRLHRLVGRQA